MSIRYLLFFVFAAIVLLKLLSLVQFVRADSTPPVISNIQVVNITATSATIMWETDEPATSQLIKTSTSLQPHRRFPEPRDSGLVTSHSIDLDDLLPNTAYYYHVSSADADENANAWSTSVSQLAQFTTSSVDGDAPFDFRIDVAGPANVYAGSDLYFNIRSVQLAGSSTPHLYPAKAVSGLPESISYYPVCASYLNISSEPVGTPSLWCWQASNSKFGARFSVGAETPPGQYTATITMEAGGLQKDFTYTFTVNPVPAAPVKQIVSPVPALPDLATWETKMLTLGEKWCDGKTYSEGWEADVWYYDGGRVYLQIGDYTKNYAKWVPCAENVIRQYREWAQGSVSAWRKFPHGMAMYYWRFGDEESLAGVVGLYNSSNNSSMNAASLLWGALSDPFTMRELAYGINTLIVGEQVGQPRSQFLARMVDGGLAMFDQLFVSDEMQFNQPFMSGLLAESLISYYELTGDTRIPPTIKQMLDWYWNNGIDQVTGEITYNHLYVPSYYLTGLNNLLIPAYAWYWNITGDDVYRQRGDFLFSHALDEDISWNGKVFSQNYKWSFDYVRWRQGLEHSTVHPDENPPVASDATPPVISALTISGVSSDAAVVSWTTNELADSQVEYGTDSSYGLSTALIPDKTLNHTHGLLDLASSTAYFIRVMSADSWGNSTVSPGYTFTTTESSSLDDSFAPIRINAGGAAYVDSEGISWDEDANYTGGAAYTNTNTVHNSADIPLYKPQRTGTSFSYSFDLPNGNYFVNLKFAEIYYSSANQRKFNVISNGRTVLSSLDIVAESGGNQRPLDKMVIGIVADGTLELEFESVTNSAAVSAIEILKASDAITFASDDESEDSDVSNASATSLSGSRRHDLPAQQPVLLPASSSSSSVLPEIREKLLSYLQALFDTIQQLQILISRSAAPAVLTKDLEFDMTDPEVNLLQEKLKAAGIFDGPVTGYFGPLTLKAVRYYQKKHGITPVSGFVGPKTRLELNSEI